jgi:hypothetical protein
MAQTMFRAVCIHHLPLELTGSNRQTKSGEEKYHRQEEKWRLTGRQTIDAVFIAGSPV